MLIALIALFITFGSYARKETVGGVVAPPDGALVVIATGSGVIEKLLVSEGQDVRRGDTIAVVTSSTVVEFGETLSVMLGDAVNAKSRAIANRELAEAEKYAASRDAIANELDLLITDTETIDETGALFAERVALAERDVQVMTGLVAEGAESAMRLRAATANLLELRISMQQLKSRRAEVMRQRVNLASQTRQIRATFEQAQAELQRAGATIAEKRATLSGNTRTLLRAEVDGRVSTLNVRVGTVVAPGSAITTILPNGYNLEARIWLPSRSIRFVSTGDEVRVMYDAFPFQHFGLAAGHISTVAPAPTSVKDLPPELNAAEPMYLATVTLVKQAVARGEKSWPLRPGMRLKADIILESRTFLDWLLVPFKDWTERQSSAANAV